MDDTLLSKYRRGVAAQHIVRANLQLSGHMTATPDGEFNPYDLIAIVNGLMYKIQVKSSESDGVRIKIDIRKPSAKGRQYTSNDYDILAIVDLRTSRVAYIPKCSVGVTRQITLFTVSNFSRQGMRPGYEGILFDNLNDILPAIECANKLRDAAV